MEDGASGGAGGGRASLGRRAAANRRVPLEGALLPCRDGRSFASGVVPAFVETKTVHRVEVARAGCPAAGVRVTRTVERR